MKPEEILRGAAAEVEKGWGRGVMENDFGEVCSAGAMRKAAFGRAYPQSLDRQSPEYNVAICALAEVMFDQCNMPDPGWHNMDLDHLSPATKAKMVVIDANDWYVKDADEVILYMEKAALQCEEMP
jgi:hypothetical protein